MNCFGVLVVLAGLCCITEGFPNKDYRNTESDLIGK